MVRIKQPVRKSGRQPKTNKVSKAEASLLALPFEVKVFIFRYLANASWRDLDEYANAQRELARVCLICSDLKDAARAVLLRSPLLNYQTGNVRNSFIRAFDMDKEEANDAARKINSWAMVNVPTGSHNRQSRITVMEGVFELANLNSLYLTTGRRGQGPAIGLNEVIMELARNDARCQKSLVNIHLEGYSSNPVDAVEQLAYFYTFPKLQTLHLELSESSLRSVDLDVEQPKRPVISRLKYFYFGLYGANAKFSETQAAVFLKQLPKSLVTFAFFADFSKSTNLDAIFRLPNLRYLALQCFVASQSPAKPQSPSSLRGFYYQGADKMPSLSFDALSTENLQYLHIDHINVSALACALEAEEMPDLRLLSFGSLHAEEEEGIAQASTRVVKRICKARKIDYQPEVVTAFQHWLAAIEASCGEIDDHEPTFSPLVD